jgi:prolyl 4-hydroxylase
MCSSDKLSFEKRCPFDKNAPTAWNAGDLNKMFERITTDPKNEGRITIISRPPTGPWIVTLDDFMTPQQAQNLIDLGSEIGYNRSKDVGEEQFDNSYDSVESNSRTYAWCVDKCYEDDTSKDVLGTIEDLTGIPEANYEYLQLLQYEETQSYASHHGEFVDPCLVW